MNVSRFVSCHHPEPLTLKVSFDLGKPMRYIEINGIDVNSNEAEERFKGEMLAGVVNIVIRNTAVPKTVTNGGCLDHMRREHLATTRDGCKIVVNPISIIDNNLSSIMTEGEAFCKHVSRIYVFYVLINYRSRH